MLVAKCRCGIDLVFDDRLASHINQCPACERPMHIAGTDAAPADSVDHPALLTSVCGCGKMLVVEQAAAGEMVRCPACDRLVGTLHEFGTEHWHSAKPDEPGEKEPVSVIAQPLAFQYSRGGLAAILFGLLMLVTLFTPWMVRNQQGEVETISTRALLKAFLDPAQAAGQIMFPREMLTFVVMAWGAGAVAVVAGLLLRGKVRAIVVTAAGLVSAYAMLNYLTPTMKDASPVDTRLLVPFVLFLLIPLFVLTNLRQRIGPRGLLMFLLGLFAAVVVAAGVASMALLGRSYFVGNWDGGFFHKVGHVWSFVQEPSVLLCLGLAFTGALLLLQAVLSKLNTLTISMAATLLLVGAGLGAAVLFVAAPQRNGVDYKVPVLGNIPVAGKIDQIDANTIAISSNGLDPIVYVFDEDTTHFFLDNQPVGINALDSGMSVDFSRDEDGLIEDLHGYSTTAETWVAINLIVLIGGTVALLIMGLTDPIAGALATPEDWRKP